MQKNRFRPVTSVISKRHGVIEVGDTVHIKRYYYPEETLKFDSAEAKLNNPVMVDVQAKVTMITVDESDPDYRDTIWCGQFSTSTRDGANKGVVK
jgi:hypothetical protein